MTGPYRSPADIAADMPAPRKERKPWLSPMMHHFLWLLGAVLVEGAIVDVWERWPRYHGCLGASAVAVGLIGFRASALMVYEGM